jgi:alpha-D-ribose 1-methylphosphonate 5-triphosphate diphosphatase PhnM
MLQAIYKLARNGSASFGDAQALVTLNAAALAGLDDRGTFEIGRRGDAILVAPGEVPRVVATICAGRIAYLAPDAVQRLG